MIRIIAFLASMFLVCASECSAESAATKPNVLFIAVDDLNTNLSCYGHPLVKTPNIDKLAARGIRFENAQCNYPLCNPSRTSLLSGMRPERTRIMDNSTLPRTYLKDVVFMPEYFKKHGYYTSRSGKIGHGPFERQISWDAVMGPGAQKTAGTSATLATAEKAKGGKGGKAGKGKTGRKKDKQEAGASANDTTTEADSLAAEEDDGPAIVVRDGKRVPFGARPSRKSDEQEADGMIASSVIKQLELAKGKREPFFIACGFHRPHTPYTAPQKYFDMYPLSSIKLPDNEPADDRKDIPELSLVRNRPDPAFTPEERKAAIQGYYASISFMDAQAGRVLDALDRLQLTSNTIVVFFGDHGQHLGEHGGLYRKTSLYEEADRVPLMYAGPGIPAAGTICKRPVDLLSLFPTLLELTSLPANPAAEGRSIVKLLRDPDTAWPHQAVTTLAWKGVLGHSLRTERYRYNEWDGGEKGRELFDRSADPNEYTNLAEDPAHAQTVEEMHNRVVREIAPRGTAAETTTSESGSSSGAGGGKKERRRMKKQR